ncbi:murein L,D-transpeptidase [Candidimonas sp. SYP-B2681]|nr:murein L,D-transpeptidase [Candidimonas sp. SYP-B2681]
MLLSVFVLVCSGSTVAQEALLWFSEGRPNLQAFDAVQILRTAQLDGLEPDDYDAAALDLGISSSARGAALPAAAIAQLDSVLSAAMQRYLSDLHNGRLDPKQAQQLFTAPALRYFDVATYLNNAVISGELKAAVRRAAPQMPQYESLRKALVQYHGLVGHSAWLSELAQPIEKKVEPGQFYAGIDLLVHRLIATRDLPPGTIAPEVYEGVLIDGVRAFQERHGLPPDGILGNSTFQQLNMTPADRVRQIELTMERLRWTPVLQGPRVIVVNIPEFVLRAYDMHEGGQHAVTEMRIIVGRALDTRTPVFNEDMRFIEFSPYWNVPRSITRSEIIPRLRRDPDYFQRQGFEFVSTRGEVISGLSGESLDALQRGELRIRQRPGPTNALGDIKFIFPNDQNIFLHHTPAPELFDRYRRDFSHGCIRIENPVALARFVLHDDPEWSEERIREAMRRGKSRTIRLDQPVPVLIAYSTAVVKNDKVYFFSDIYGHDNLLDRALSQHIRGIPY